MFELYDYEKRTERGLLAIKSIDERTGSKVEEFVRKQYLEWTKGS